MKLIIDDANVAAIRELYEYYPVSGVTTNPSILAKSGRQPYEVLKEIRSIIGDEAELHAQVISAKAEDMIEEAHKIVAEVGGNMFVKVPAIREGIKAIKVLAKEGYKITATAIYAPMQGYLAGEAGAVYAAPYVNRIDNLGGNGVAVAKQIHDIYENNGMKTQVLAASFKNSQQVLELADYGIGAATVAPDVMEGLLKNDIVDCAVAQFVKDFQGLCGDGATML
ncbi:MAG: transaldolase family protein [Lachnospiraceae bacterium]|nr:transaldolase family protein [Lachnospiraceae bacterium]